MMNMNKSDIIKNVVELLLADRKQESMDFANKNYPFISPPSEKRQYSKYQMSEVFRRDGFIDRYSGEKLLFPGLIKILTIEFPDIFKYQVNWKMSETHIVYWHLFPTIDHLIPIARGGQNSESNWITTSMMRNSAKSNFLLEEINWKLYDRGRLSEWDGLTNYFFKLVQKNPVYENDKYIHDWKIALLKVIDG